jgi:septal ring-binding cell division protein DamX
MAKERSGASGALPRWGLTEDGTSQRSAWALVGSVVGVLVLGALLRSDPTAVVAGAAPVGPPQPAARVATPLDPDPAAAVPGGDGVPVRTRPSPAGLPPLHALAQRAAGDAERLASSGDGWTAQLALLCDPERASRLVEEFGALEPFHLLPTLHDGRACFLVCWGAYASRDRARQAADLPAALRSLGADPLPKSIAQVLP